MSNISFSIQRNTNNICIMVSAMETTILSESEQEITTVRTYARQRNALIWRNCIIYNFLLAETVCCKIEWTTIEIILHLRIGCCDIHTLHFLWKRNRLTVVEIFAIRRPCRIHFQKIRIIADNAHRILLHIIENHVAGKVIDLNLIRICRMESLTCLIGRESYQFGSWMPWWIYTRRDGIITFQINLWYLTIINNNGTTIRETYMEEHIVRFVILITVTVDTLAFSSIIAGNLIIKDLCLFEWSEVALSNLHKWRCDISRLNKTIRHIFVNWLFSYIYFKWFER